ncbi:MAG: hypothetical protein PHO20_05195 [Candidatus Peribacteraceae bacterium]|nr:hypothetical protein [Candidatus Peribacteraceae bacterium]MDD5740131.1 hypothetical protein [Candidatus Peribacteraceae bacterium]
MFTTGPAPERTRGVLAHIAERVVGQLGAAIGRIEPWREQCRWVDLHDPYGNRMGRVSVHTIPNGHTSRVAVFIHGVSLYTACVSTVPLALRDAGSSEVRGEWQGTASCCRFTVPRDRSVTLGLPTAKLQPQEDTVSVVQGISHDELEQIQECLERDQGRKEKRPH